jgi:hypothetical protein
MEEEKKNLSNSEDILQRLSNLPTSEQIQKKYDEEQKHEFSPSDVAVPAAGAILGGVAKYKGLDEKASNIFSNVLKPSPGLTEPTPGMQKRFISKVLPKNTPAMSGQALTEAELRNLIASTPGTVGSNTPLQKEVTHNVNTQARSRTQNAMESMHPSLVGTINDPVVRAGPQVAVGDIGLTIPMHEAAALHSNQPPETKLTPEQIKLQAKILEQNKRAGYLTGAGRIAKGAGAGAIAAPQLYNYVKDLFTSGPRDDTQLMSGLGALAMIPKNKYVNAVGAALQLPYGVKHMDQLLNSMTMHDIDPIAFPLGTAESSSSPLQEPTSFSNLVKPLSGSR